MPDQDVIERAADAHQQATRNVPMGAECNRGAMKAAIRVVLEDLARDQNPRMIQRYAREELGIEIDLPKAGKS